MDLLKIKTFFFYLNSVEHSTGSVRDNETPYVKKTVTRSL